MQFLELVRFKVGGTLIRLTSSTGHEVMRDGTWVRLSILELREIIGRDADAALSVAVINSVQLHRGDADKIKAHFLSMLRLPEYRALGFVDVTLN